MCNKIEIDKGTLTHYYIDRNQEVVYIPKNATKIGSNFLKNYSDCIKKVIIPSSIKSIEPFAFYNCIKLECVEFEDENSDVKIDEGAFYGCSSLSSIMLPQQLKTISKQSFYGCSSLKKVQISNSVEQIENDAFGKCISLEQLIIPPTVKIISSCAFYCCSKLETITIQGNKHNNRFPLIIESLAFIGCKNLKVINFHKEIQRVASKAFYLCESLLKININEKQSDFCFECLDKNWDEQTGEFVMTFTDETTLTKIAAKQKIR